MVADKKAPEIRFEGFDREWIEMGLGELCDEFQSGAFIKATDITHSGAYPIYGGNGFRGYANTYNHDGEYALIGRQGALCGNMNYASGKSYFTEHAVAVKANKDNVTRFLFYLFGTMDLGQYSGQSAQPGLAVGNLTVLRTMLPGKEEQTAISNFFCTLDDVINLKKHQHEKTVNIKKAMLEKMFPRNGADVPEIRFKGFGEPWETEIFGTICNIVRGGSPRPIENYITPSENGINWIKIGDVDRNAKYINRTEEKIIPEGLSKSRIVNKGDFILSNSMSFGRPYIMQIYGCIHDGWLAIQNYKDRFDTEFLYYLLSSECVMSQYKEKAAGSTVKNLNKDLVASIEVSIPYIEEQNAIAVFLSSLDSLITSQQQELEKLQNIKKACLNKMFV